MAIEVDEAEGDASCAMVAGVAEGGAAWAAGVREGACLRGAVALGARDECSTLSFDGQPFDAVMAGLTGLGDAAVALAVEEWG